MLGISTARLSITAANSKFFLQRRVGRDQNEYTQQSYSITKILKKQQERTVLEADGSCFISSRFSFRFVQHRIEKDKRIKRFSLLFSTVRTGWLLGWFLGQQCFYVIVLPGIK